MILVSTTVKFRCREKQSDDRSAAFYGQLERLAMFVFGLASLLSLTPQVNHQYKEKGNPLQSTVPHL